MPDEVFRDWKSIRIKEEEVKESIFSARVFLLNIFINKTERSIHFY
jgi:hypothetical protein